jgi:hypothetical protein
VGGCKRAAWRAGTEATADREEEQEQEEEEEEEEALPHTKRDALAWQVWDEVHILYIYMYICIYICIYVYMYIYIY